MPLAPEPLIIADNVSRIYGKGEAKVVALGGVSFDIHRGEFVAIVGASGSGKSTLMNLLGALDKPTDGQITVSGVKLGQSSARKLSDFRNKTIGFVFQKFEKSESSARFWLLKR